MIPTNNNPIPLKEIDRLILGKDTPLWSDPRNVNTLSCHSLSLRTESAPSEESNPYHLAWSEAVKPKNPTFKKAFHKLINGFISRFPFCHRPIKKKYHILQLRLSERRQNSKTML